eukprot:scaffold212013_cov34-Prasinocladus_malaysianus.AAC.1
MASGPDVLGVPLLILILSGRGDSGLLTHRWIFASNVSLNVPRMWPRPGAGTQWEQDSMHPGACQMQH